MIRDYLRGLPVFAGDLPKFDPAGAPERPDELFVTWLVEAVQAGVREPHAATLSTVGVDDVPSARILIVKNVDESGWQFAVHGDSPKGRELGRRPVAAMTFYWPAQARQVRVRGVARTASASESAADFLARPMASRAEAALGRQSQPLDERAGAVALDPDVVVPEWTLYTLEPGQVEFWQGDEQRKHTRLRYSRGNAGWERELLWP
ncbi:pyridoxine/pyridoxamine 5'-phosphate oxidase [Actinoplanes sp. HUAS TT8]|uniref:pyridoxine/pyridoxamine 5'-phosphate oxidase n=1 Tax=Actinoplanes sp. HUAS TT8 TaxID=3447453 RepID=UPI003F51E2C7